MEDHSRVNNSNEMETVPLKSKAKDKARKKLWESLIEVYEKENGERYKGFKLSNSLQQIVKEEIEYSDLSQNLNEPCDNNNSKKKKKPKHSISKVHNNETGISLCNLHLEQGTKGSKLKKHKDKAARHKRGFNQSIKTSLLQKDIMTNSPLIILHQREEKPHESLKRVVESKTYHSRDGQLEESCIREKGKLKNKAYSKKILENRFPMNQTYLKIKKECVEKDHDDNFQRSQVKVKKRKDKGLVYKTLSYNLQPKKKNKKRKPSKHHLLRKVTKSLGITEDILGQIKNLPIEFDEDQLIFMDPSHIAKLLEYCNDPNGPCMNTLKCSSNTLKGDEGVNTHNIQCDNNYGFVQSVPPDSSKQDYLKKLRKSTVKESKKLIPVNPKNDKLFLPETIEVFSCSNNTVTDEIHIKNEISKHRKVEKKKNISSSFNTRKNVKINKKVNPLNKEIIPEEDVIPNFSVNVGQSMNRGQCKVDNFMSKNINKNIKLSTTCDAIASESLEKEPLSIETQNMVYSTADSSYQPHFKKPQVKKENISKILQPNGFVIQNVDAEKCGTEVNLAKPSISEDGKKLTFQLVKTDKNVKKLRKKLYSISKKHILKSSKDICNSSFKKDHLMLFYANRESFSTSKESLKIAISRDTEISNNGSTNNILNVVIKQTKNSTSSTKTIPQVPKSNEKEYHEKYDADKFEGVNFESGDGSLIVDKPLKETGCQTDEILMLSNSREQAIPNVAKHPLIDLDYKEMNKQHVFIGQKCNNSMFGNLNLVSESRNTTKNPETSFESKICKINPLASEVFMNSNGQNLNLYDESELRPTTRQSLKPLGLQVIDPMFPQSVLERNSEKYKFNPVSNKGDASQSKHRSNPLSDDFIITSGPEFNSRNKGLKVKRNKFLEESLVKKTQPQTTESENLAFKLKQVGLSIKKSFVRIIESKDIVQLPFTATVTPQNQSIAILPTDLMTIEKSLINDHFNDLQATILNIPNKLQKNETDEHSEQCNVSPSNNIKHDISVNNNFVKDQHLKENVIEREDKKVTKHLCKLQRDPNFSLQAKEGDTVDISQEVYKDVALPLKENKKNSTNIVSSLCKSESVGVDNFFEVSNIGFKAQTPPNLKSNTNQYLSNKQDDSSIPLQKNVNHVQRPNNKSTNYFLLFENNETPIKKGSFLRVINSKINLKSDSYDDSNTNKKEEILGNEFVVNEPVNQENINNITTGYSTTDKKSSEIKPHWENKNSYDYTTSGKYNSQPEIITKVNAIYDFFKDLDKVMKVSPTFKFHNNSDSICTKGALHASCCLCSSCKEMIEKNEGKQSENLHKDVVCARNNTELNFGSPSLDKKSLFVKVVDEPKSENRWKTHTPGMKFINISDIENPTTDQVKRQNKLNHKTNPKPFFVIIPSDEKISENVRDLNVDNSLEMCGDPISGDLKGLKHEFASSELKFDLEDQIDNLLMKKKIKNCQLREEVLKNIKTESEPKTIDLIEDYKYMKERKENNNTTQCDKCQLSCGVVNSDHEIETVKERKNTNCDQDDKHAWDEKHKNIPLKQSGGTLSFNKNIKSTYLESHPYLLSESLFLDNTDLEANTNIAKISKHNLHCAEPDNSQLTSGSKYRDTFLGCANNFQKNGCGCESRGFGDSMRCTQIHDGDHLDTYKSDIQRQINEFEIESHENGTCNNKVQPLLNCKPTTHARKSEFSLISQLKTLGTSYVPFLGLVDKSKVLGVDQPSKYKLSPRFNKNTEIHKGSVSRNRIHSNVKLNHLIHRRNNCGMHRKCLKRSCKNKANNEEQRKFCLKERISSFDKMFGSHPYCQKNKNQDLTQELHTKRNQCNEFNLVSSKPFNNNMQYCRSYSDLSFTSSQCKMFLSKKRTFESCGKASKVSQKEMLLEEVRVPNNNLHPESMYLKTAQNQTISNPIPTKYTITSDKQCLNKKTFDHLTLLNSSFVNSGKFEETFQRLDKKPPQEQSNKKLRESLCSLRHLGSESSLCSSFSQLNDSVEFFNKNYPYKGSSKVDKRSLLSKNQTKVTPHLNPTNDCILCSNKGADNTNLHHLGSSDCTSESNEIEGADKNIQSNHMAAINEENNKVRLQMDIKLNDVMCVEFFCQPPDLHKVV